MNAAEVSETPLPLVPRWASALRESRSPSRPRSVPNLSIWASIAGHWEMSDWRFSPPQLPLSAPSTPLTVCREAAASRA